MKYIHIDGYAHVRALGKEMLAQRQIVELPNANDIAFALAPGERTSAIRAASDAIHPMFWAERLSIDTACTIIRQWITREFS